MKLKGIRKRKESTKKSTNFRLEKDTILFLKEVANENNTTMTRVLEYFISEKRKEVS